MKTKGRKKSNREVLRVLEGLLGLGSPIVLSLSPGLPGLANTQSRESAEKFLSQQAEAENLLNRAEECREDGKLQEAKNFLAQAGQIIRDLPQSEDRERLVERYHAIGTSIERLIRAMTL